MQNHDRRAILQARLVTAFPYLVLLAQVLIFYRHVLFYDGYVIPWDFRYDHFPIASFLADSFQRGELPLWDPYTYCGRPLYANMQAQLFYPPTLLTILLSNWTGGEHLFYLLEWQLALHIFLGGVFVYWLLLGLSTGRPAALLGATVYQLGAHFASQTQHLGAVDGAGWMPLTWLAILSLRNGITRRRLALLAFSLAMVTLAGLPSLAAVVFTSCALLALALAAFRLASIRVVAGVVAASVGAILLAAVQLFPTSELTSLSVAGYRGDWLGTGGGLPLASLVSLVAPNYYGIFDLESYSLPYDPTLIYTYCGIATLVLCLAAAVRPRRRETAMFAVFTLVSALWMLGDSTPIGKVVYFLFPGFIQIALHPEFALASFVLSIAVLAGLSAGQFLKRPALAYAVTALIAVDLILVSSGRPMNAFPTAKEPGVDHNHFDGSAELLAAVRGLVNENEPPARIDTVNDSLSWAMCAPLTEVPSANGNDPFALARLIQVRLAFCDGERWGRYYQVSKIDSPVLDLINVRYLLSRKPIDETQLERANFVLRAKLPGREVYENRDVLPRFFLVNRLRKAADLSQAAAMLHSEDFDPRTEAIVEGEVDLQSTSGSAEGTVRLVEYGPRELVLVVESPAPAFLVTSEAHYPGWRAFVDGEPQPLFYTNVAFRGLPVPTGKHEVRMRFAPAILWRSAAVSAVAWVFLIGVAVFPERPRKGPQS